MTSHFLALLVLFASRWAGLLVEIGIEHDDGKGE
jgi:hypothetical protein